MNAKADASTLTLDHGTTMKFMATESGPNRLLLTLKLLKSAKLKRLRRTMPVRRRLTTTPKQPRLNSDQITAVAPHLHAPLRKIGNSISIILYTPITHLNIMQIQFKQKIINLFHFRFNQFS